MKSYLSKLSVVLLGVALAVSGCQDYDEDIRKVNAQLTQDVENISGVTDALDAAIAELESKHDVDINALKSDLQGVEADLAAKATELEEAIDEASAAAAALIKANAENDAADKKELQEKINTLTLNVASRLAELEADYKEADQQLNQTIGQLMSTAMSQISGLQTQVNTLSNRATALERTAEELQDNIDAAVAKAANELAAAKSELTTSIGFLSTQIADAIVRIEANEKEIADLKTALKDAKDELQDAIDAEEAARVAADNAEAAAREQAINDLNAALSARIDAEVAARELLEQKVDTEVATLKGLIDDTNDALADEIEAREQAIETVEGEIDQLGEDLEAAKTELEQKIADETEARKDGDDKLAADLAIERAKIEKNITDIAGLRTDLEDYVEALDLRIKANADRIAANETAIGAINTELENRRIAFEAYKTEVTNALATKADKTELQAAIKKAEDELAAAIEAEQEARAQALEDLKTEITEITDALDERLTTLEGKVENLASQIQKLVYVPEYTDGKANVPYAKLDGKVVEGKKFWLTYKVYPEFKNEGELFMALGKNLRADIIPVTNITRAGETATVSVHEILPKDGSHFMVALRVNDLKDEFYLEPSVDGKTSYALSLILDDENTVISSEYTNLYPENLGDITMVLYGKNTDNIDTKLTDAEPARTVPFTDVNQTFDILKTHRVTFFAGAEEIGAYNVLTNQWPELEGAFEANVKYLGDGADLFLKENTPNEATLLNNVQVKLDPAQVNKENVGKKINVIYEYTLGATTRSAGSVITIDKEPLKFVLPAQTATWTYTLDKNADAYLFNNTLPLATYNRTFEDLTADVDNAASGVTIADLDGITPTVTVTENGTAVATPDITLTVDAANNNMDVTYNNFAWDKTYNVEAVYELPYSKVTVAFEFNTVNREAGAIDITLAPQTFELYKDILEEGDNRSLESMVQLLKDKNYLDADADAAEYLADYKANAPAMSGRKVVAGGADYITGETTSTGFQFATGDYSNVYPKIYYANFPADEQIPTEMTYKAVITTWYGQVINISQVINIDLPAYDYKHSEIYVKEANGGYFSQVRGKYEDSSLNINLNTPDLLYFSVDKVDMFAAFSVVDENGDKLNEAAITAAGLARKFAIEVAPESADIKFDTDGRYLEYNGADASVPVIGDLRLVNTNGSYAVLPTSFETTYADYIVKKLNPIGKLAARVAVLEKKILDDDVYTVNILSNFTLPENRVGADKNYDLIDAATNKWTVGTGTNGFADTKVGKDIYDINFSWNDIANQIPAELSDRISYDDATFTIKFNNVGNLGIVKDVEINIELSISYLWGTDKASFKLLFPKNIAE